MLHRLHLSFEMPNLARLNSRAEKNIANGECHCKRRRDEVSHENSAIRLRVAWRKHHRAIRGPTLQYRSIPRSENVLIGHSTDGGTTNVMWSRRHYESGLRARAHMRKRIALQQIGSWPRPTLSLR